MTHITVISPNLPASPATTHDTKTHLNTRQNPIRQNPYLHDRK